VRWAKHGAAEWRRDDDLSDIYRREISMKTLFILNDAPYGTERSYNGLRLAKAVSKLADQQVQVFLMGDAVACAKDGQKVPDGYYNAGDMVKMVAAGGEVGLCGTCMNARGLQDGEVVAGALRKTLADLAAWTAAADKVLVF
jgi:uncharacterized protein involved in oxidation of intracellular sulfur